MSARDQVGEQQDPPDEREVLQEEIAQTREELGETVEALVNKADVKSQVHDKVEETKAHVQGRVEETKAHVQGRVAETKQDLQDKQQEVVGQTADLARRPTTYWAIAGAAVALLLLGRLRGR